MKIYIVDNDLVVIDGKRYTKDREYNVAVIQHPNSKQKYYFQYNPNRFNDDDIKDKHVIINTMRGNAVGYVCDVQKMQLYELMNGGAYLPLKQVLRYATGEEIKDAYEYGGRT